MVHIQTHILLDTFNFFHSPLFLCPTKASSILLITQNYQICHLHSEAAMHGEQCQHELITVFLNLKNCDV